MNLVSFSRLARTAAALVFMAGTLSCGGGGGGGAPDVQPPPPAVVPAPEITLQPADQSVLAGASASFTVGVKDATGVSYQWLRNGVELAGATQASHLLGPVALADSGTTYAVRASNAGGSVTSRAAALTVALPPAPPQPDARMVSLFAGSIGGPGNLDGTATLARFNNPAGLAADANGNLYVSDSGNATVRKIAPGAVVSVVAGITGQPAPLPGVLGARGVAQFTSPGPMALDPVSGALYVIDDGYSLRRVDAAGTVTAADSPYLPKAIGAGAQGLMFIAAGFVPSELHLYRAGNPLQHLAGGYSANTPGPAADGTGANARFGAIAGIAVGAGDVAFVADSTNHTIRRVTAAGVVTTWAGAAGQAGAQDGPGATARFNSPGSLTLDANGNLYVADTGNLTIRKIDAQGRVTTAAREVPLSANSQLAVDSAGTLHISTAHGVAMLTASGSVQLVAGTLQPAEGQSFGKGIFAVDGQGHVYSARSTTAGIVIGKRGADGNPAALGSQGEVLLAMDPPAPFFGVFPYLVAAALGIDAAGNLYCLVGDGRRTPANSLYKISPTGSVTAIALPNGEGYSPPFAIDAQGAFYFARNSTLRRRTAAGLFEDVAPLGTMAFGAIGLVVGPAGRALLSDPVTHAVYQLQDGGFRLLAGNTGLAATLGNAFDKPASPVLDSAGNLYVRDTHLIRKIAPDGAVSVLAGRPDRTGTLLGALPASLPANTDARQVLLMAPGDVLYVEADNAVLKIPLK